MSDDCAVALPASFVATRQPILFKLAQPRFLYSTDYEPASVSNEFAFSQRRLDVDCSSSIRSRSSHLQERSCNFGWMRVTYTRVGYGPTSKSSRWGILFLLNVALKNHCRPLATPKPLVSEGVSLVRRLPCEHHCHWLVFLSCQGTSAGGKQLGLMDERTALLKEMFRVWDTLPRDQRRAKSIFKAKLKLFTFSYCVFAPDALCTSRMCTPCLARRGT